MLEMMHYFAAVVEHSSLNKASQLLNLSQPALSRKITKLEEQLGVELFTRNGKKLELTRIGQLTYEFALELRQIERDLLQTIAEYKATDKSTVTIGASLTTLQSTLPDLINVFLTKYPNTEMKAITGKTHEIVTLVREKKVDIGLVASLINEPHLHCLPLFEDHLVLVLPKQHALNSKKPIDIQHLNGLPMILFSRGTWYRILTDDLFHRFRVIPDVRMEIDSFEAIIRLLVTGKSATLLPHSYLRTQMLEDNGLNAVHLRELEQTKRTTSLIYADPTSLSTSAQLLIQEASNYVKLQSFSAKPKNHGS